MIDLNEIDAGPRVDSGSEIRRDAGNPSTGNEKGPIVQITSPVASSDPLVGPVLVGPSVDVQCEAHQRTGKAPVDPTKVNISVYRATPGASTDPILKVPATLRATDTYGASVAMTSVPTGRVRFRCSALDSTPNAPNENTNDIETFYDAGPVVTFTNVNESSIIQRGTDRNIDLALQFKVEPARLAENDTGADIADVKLSVSERDVMLGLPAEFTYTKEIDFLDFFAGAPIESVTLEITATNKRGPTPSTVRKKLLVRVDGKGPTITFKAPTGSPPLVGGTVTVEVTITDDLAGVAEGDDKIYALIQDHDATRNYRLTRDGEKYRFTFEASAFPGKADVTATIYAEDKAGNKDHQGLLMRLDTIPPWVSLDPPDVREITGNPRRCSGPFDPVGNSPEPGQVVGVETLFRAIVWERGIELDSTSTVWIAGVRDETVKLYAQSYGSAAPFATTPLLIDEDHDVQHYCDAINSTPSDGRAPSPQGLKPVTGGGQQPLGTDTFASDPAVSADACEPITNQSPPRCGDGDTKLRYVINHTMVGTPSVVYASAPTDNNAGCTGTEFDLGGPGGWTCIVAVARDRSGVQGNLGVSEPLCVCRKLSATDCDGAAVGEKLTVPAELTATDGCVLPPIWQEPAMPRFLNH